MRAVFIVALIACIFAFAAAVPIELRPETATKVDSAVKSDDGVVNVQVGAEAQAESQQEAHQEAEKAIRYGAWNVSPPASTNWFSLIKNNWGASAYNAWW